MSQTTKNLIDQTETQIQKNNNERQRLIDKLLSIQNRLDTIDSENDNLRRKQVALYSKLQQEQEEIDEICENSKNPGTTSTKKVLLVEKCNKLARKYYGFELRKHQLQGIEACLKHKDCVCIMATGAGKSVIYQLSTLMVDRGFTLVIFVGWFPYHLK